MTCHEYRHAYIRPFVEYLGICLTHMDTAMGSIVYASFVYGMSPIGKEEAVVHVVTAVSFRIEAGSVITFLPKDFPLS